MKIALVAPVEETIPPEKYGGIEWVVYYLAHGLAAKGHEVHLLASGDSKQETNYKLIPISPTSLRGDPQYDLNPALLESKKDVAMAKAAEIIQAGNYDIVHNHAAWRFLILSRVIGKKIVTTHHGPLDIEFQNQIFNEYKDLPYISISEEQRTDLPDLNYVATVYNGIDPDLFPYAGITEGANDYLLFFARMDPEKGGLEAATAAKTSGRRLIMAAKVDAIDQEYFSKVKPLIDGKLISFVGEVGMDKKIDYYQKARALIAPIMWKEPFGLYFIESMSCGTPVIAFARGSAPEIIEDGKTGFLVNPSDEQITGEYIIKKTGIDGICEAIERMYSLPNEEYLQMREYSRKHVVDHFTADRMVNEYEEIYKKILSQA